MAAKGPGAGRAQRGQRRSEEAATRIRFRTVNGSLYEIDLGAGVWLRIARTGRSGKLRTEGGEIVALAPLQLGRSAALLFLPFNADVVRFLVTSAVISIEPQGADRPN
jgi:hypothetical protein